MGASAPIIFIGDNMEEKNLLIVDAHSLGYYMQEAEVVLTANDMQTQSIFGFVKAVRRQASIQKAKPVIMWDGVPLNRKAIYPEYKVQKKSNERLDEMREHFRKQKPYIRAMMSVLGVEQYIANDGEADDLGAWYSKQNYDKYDNIYLYSGDSDWVQLVNDKVSFINVRDNKKSTPDKPFFRLIDKDNFAEATGFKNTMQFIQAKALVGEKSDCVPGVGGIGATGAKELLLEYGSVGDFILGFTTGEIVLEKGRYKKPFEGLATNAFNEKSNGRMLDIYKRNLLLIALNNPEIWPKNIEEIPRNFDLDKFEKLCRKLSFMSILEDIEVFVKPFERYI